MGKIKPHLPVKLIIGLIFSQKQTLEKTQNLLAGKFGKIDYQSRIMPFRHTDYYRREFGEGLKRKILGFKKLIPPENLARIKNTTNKIEQKLKIGLNRSINIDPGYLNLSKLILATNKDYSHRIYLGKKVYAEVTLVYQGKTFCGWSWTYPDYRSPEYIELFNNIRNIYSQQIKCLPHTLLPTKTDH